MLNGYKTYIIAGATIAYAIGGAILGNIDLNVAVPMILAALGIGGIRDAL